MQNSRPHPAKSCHPPPCHQLCQPPDMPQGVLEFRKEDGCRCPPPGTKNTQTMFIGRAKRRNLKQRVAFVSPKCVPLFHLGQLQCQLNFRKLGLPIVCLRKQMKRCCTKNRTLDVGVSPLAVSLSSPPSAPAPNEPSCLAALIAACKSNRTSCVLWQLKLNYTNLQGNVFWANSTRRAFLTVWNTVLVTDVDLSDRHEQGDKSKR